MTQRVLTATVVDGEALAHGMITIDSAQQLRVADVNGDSRADLVHWNDIDGTMSVRLANDPYHGGYGGFAAQELFASFGSGSIDNIEFSSDGSTMYVADSEARIVYELPEPDRLDAGSPFNEMVST